MTAMFSISRLGDSELSKARKDEDYIVHSGTRYLYCENGWWYYVLEKQEKWGGMHNIQLWQGSDRYLAMGHLLNVDFTKRKRKHNTRSAG